MRTKYINRIFTILFSVLILAEYRFLYIFPLPTLLSGSSSNKFLVSILCLCIFLIYMLVFKKFEFGLFGKQILFLFPLIFLLMSYDFAVRKYSITTILWYYLPFCILLIYFPFKKWIFNEKNYIFFIKITSVVSIVLCSLFIYQVISYRNNNVFLFIEGMYRFNSLKGLRIYGISEGLLRIFSIVLLNHILKKKFKNIVLELFAFVLIISSMIIVEQARFYLICILLSCILLYINYYGLKFNFITITIGIMIFAFGLYFLYINSVSILGSINENTGSSYARVDAIKYYLHNIFDNLIFGFGRIIPDQWSSKFLIVKGPYGIYNYDDIGVLGVLASMGITVFLWYLYAAIKLILLYKKVNPVSRSLIFLFILSMLISSYFDNVRIICLALTFAWIDREWLINEKRKNFHVNNDGL